MASDKVPQGMIDQFPLGGYPSTPPRCLNDFLVKDDICAFHVCMVRSTSVYVNTRLSGPEDANPVTRRAATPSA